MGLMHSIMCVPVGCGLGFAAGPLALKCWPDYKSKYFSPIMLTFLMLGAAAFGAMFVVGEPFSSGPGMSNKLMINMAIASGILLGFSCALGLGYSCCKDCVGTGPVPPQV